VFALCVEASHARGMGHLFRALALSEALEARGAAVKIYVNGDQGAERVLLQSGRAWQAVPLNGDEPWEPDRIRADGVRVWVNDRLETTAVHARRVLDAGALLATFDDRGSGAESAHLHVAPFPLGEGDRPAGRKVLSGLQYMVVDPAVRKHRRQRSVLQSLVVSMGGSDTYGLTVLVVRALRARKRQATIVLGPGFAHNAELGAELDSSFVVKRDLKSLVEEFAQHDLAITAGGITPFEANAAGLPCIVIGAESWEERAGELLGRLGGCRYAGARTRIDFSALDEELPLREMSAAALASVPADGSDRVAAELLAL
jgi:spore coat polysaccharide biosynthesis predicted glycosyltransferase SpsG